MTGRRSVVLAVFALFVGFCGVVVHLFKPDRGSDR